jgi:hypothetical protein
MRKGAVFLLVTAWIGLLACGHGGKGDSCGDEGRVGGDCKDGLLCARSKPDDTSPLVCLSPCDSQTNCESNETCSGDRGRDLQACRPNN